MDGDSTNSDMDPDVGFKKPNKDYRRAIEKAIKRADRKRAGRKLTNPPTGARSSTEESSDEKPPVITASASDGNVPSGASIYVTCRQYSSLGSPSVISPSLGSPSVISPRVGRLFGPETTERCVFGATVEGHYCGKVTFVRTPRPGGGVMHVKVSGDITVEVATGDRDEILRPTESGHTGLSAPICPGTIIKVLGLPYVWKIVSMMVIHRTESQS